MVSLSEPAELSVTQLPELKSNIVLVKNLPACISPAGQILECCIPSEKMVSSS